MLPFEMKGSCKFTQPLNFSVVWPVGNCVAQWLWDLIRIGVWFFIFSDGLIKDEWLNIKKSRVFYLRQSAGVGVSSFKIGTILLM